MQNTTNYNLSKPQISDDYSPNDYNNNMDIIDEKLKENEDAISSLNEKMPKTKIITGTSDADGNLSLGSYPSLTILSAVSLRKSSYVKRVFLNDYNIWYAEVVDNSGNAIANAELTLLVEIYLNK